MNAFKTTVILVTLLILQSVHATDKPTPATPKSTQQQKVTGSETTEHVDTAHSTPKGATVVHHSSSPVEEKSTGTQSHTGSNPTTIGETGTATHSTPQAKHGTSTSPLPQKTTETASSPKPTYPPGDIRNCGDKQILKLPGHGWDNLVYDEMESIFLFNYSRCQKTSDKKYLIPDEIYAAQLDYPEFKSQVFGSWDDYTNLTARQLKEEYRSDEYYDVIGSFSADYQRIKKTMDEQKAFAVRVSLKVPTYYMTLLSKKLPVSPTFRAELTEISEAFVNGQTDLAVYYARKLVAKYGTHYIKDITTGGVIATEDFVHSTRADLKNFDDVMEVRRAAEAIFAWKFNLTSQPSKDDPELAKSVKEYTAALADKSKYFVFGGEHKDISTLKATKWEKTIERNQDVVQRQGATLTSLISSTQFPELPPLILDRVRRAVDDAITLYHRYNIHSGCTDPSGTNFVFSANHNDHTCNVTKDADYAFGGVYQTCTESSGEHDFCSKLEKVNPVTGKTTCPQHFEAILLRDKALFRVLENQQATDCQLRCPKADDCVRKCEPYVNNRVEYKTYWCALTNPVKGVKGVPFGGTFTSNMVNPNGGIKSCPSEYSEVVIDQDLTVCVGKKDQHTNVAMTFGGFYSCQYENPLSEPFQRLLGNNCPKGYSSKIARFERHCVIKFCTSYVPKEDHKFPALIHIGSGKKPDVHDTTSAILVIVDQTNQNIYYRTEVTGPWKVAHSFAELKKAGLEGLYFATLTTTTTVSPKPGASTESNSKTSIHSSTESNSKTSIHSSTESNSKTSIHSSTESNNAKGTEASKSEKAGMTSGSIAAVAIVTTAAVLAAVGFGGYYYVKKRGGLNRSDSTTDLHSNESQPAESHQRSGSQGSRSGAGSHSQVPQGGEDEGQF